ncbi:hypothetical protein E2C01_064765 [Portunus trituberculatus]|uniref:Uncharacterized protein n=1 Tax=Portunus trituberculatus TaxID=210409 RepID=A0A5B7HLQ8_PORTR|nr:hypothetical protein [Portunus trituberculatus]
MGLVNCAKRNDSSEGPCRRWRLKLSRVEGRRPGAQNNA